MAADGMKIGTAVAAPKKAFFVTMLIRDISLQDALLDLLDNCVDGIIRSGVVKRPPELPYAGFKATIILEKDFFSIEDNCGGIPIEVAKNSAFAIGRSPALSGSVDAPATVGIYGIGMKRAIFKFGSKAYVESRHDQGFVVEITPEWMNDDAWDPLPMYGLAADKLSGGGTLVEVTNLHPEIAAAFSDDEWIDEFRKVVARDYSLIINKGFSVFIGRREDAEKSKIVSEPFLLMKTGDGKRDNPSIAPFMYAGVIDGVNIEIFAGIYRKLLSADEADDEEEKRQTRDDAGWTIACNDRVVVWKDRTRLTGWGEATVPNYHGQFIAITGIVLLKSDTTSKLPLTTTKRGIDASSNVYLESKEFMREATKTLTGFTNKWKKFPDKLEELYGRATSVDLAGLRALAADAEMSVTRKSPNVRKFEPYYPEPTQITTAARVSFVAAKSDIVLMADHFFEDPKAKPGIVGEMAFNTMLKQVQDASK